MRARGHPRRPHPRRENENNSKRWKRS